ncbi:DUF2726 domain-containing protein [uncultured Salinicola sp.]|uniref:DUF2726 domain-containing protein n=1 Tax=uncultured Salinicola sp. TaxID=1193542 RepID=UPI00262518DC|nr:DUF2726 domain-containing protein [uncultured Salinicola sp.]|tara:strand:+ start:3227 stop:3775 length:549 start_codon:yes stop_codon:yes gene_type:complete
MDALIEKFNELPQEAQYVIMGAGGLIGLLIIILILVVILSATKKEGGSGKPEKVKVPKRLPVAPIPVMNDREHALYKVLVTAMTSFPNHTVHPKVSTAAILGATEEEHPKVTKAILKSLIHDAHDFVILDRSRIAVAVIELDSAEDDKREEQARRAGLPIIRVKDPRVSSSEMAKRLSGILK